MISLERYKGRKVLVTGHTGFKGAWLSIWLEKMGASVAGFALDPVHNRGIFNASGIGERIQDIRGDIRELSSVLEVFHTVQPEIVFHLAAQALVIDGYKSPADTFAINTQGSVNILEAIRLTPSVKSAVMITTDKCYENREWIWGYRENDPMGGHDPYSASKGAAELVISSYRRSFFSQPGTASVASARAGNVIGGGDWSDNRLVPDMIRAIQAGIPVQLRNPDSTRPWQHVLEPLGGYLQLGLKLLEEKDSFAEGWNFGPYTHEVQSVQQVIETIIRYAGKGQWQDMSAGLKPHEAGMLLLDITKAIQRLGWKPALTFEDAVRLTVDWYMQPEGTDMLEFSRKQIDEYTGKWK